MKLNKYDKEYIKNRYGSVKNYKQLKKEKSKKDYHQFLKEEKEKSDEALRNSSVIEAIKCGAKSRELIHQLENIEFIMSKTYSKEYNKWLLVYDLVNNSLHEIKHSLNKGKITTEELEEVVKECNRIHNVFDIDDIKNQLEYY